MTTTPDSASSQAQPVEPTQPTPLAQPAQPPKSSYSMGSVSNMARSLFVILALVLGLILIVPRVSSIQQPAVDAASVVSDAVTQSGLPFEAPVGLPSGWSATNARFTKTTDDLPTWQGGWSTPSGGYIAIRQTKAASPNWVKDATSDGTVNGSVTVAGRTWTTYYDGEHKRTSWVNLPAGAAADTQVATVVTATAEESELTTFVTALKPAARS